jgi:DNA-binding protein HU-beta
MNKEQLIEQLAGNTKLTKKDAGIAINGLFGWAGGANGVIIDAVESGDNIQLPGFGGFSTVKRAARTGRNPQTGGEVNIPASVLPKFKPGKRFKDAVN